jgi:hypothetical protein
MANLIGRRLGAASVRPRRLPDHLHGWLCVA